LERSPASLFSGKRVAVGEYADLAQAETEVRSLQALGVRIHVEEVEPPPPMPALGLLDVVLPVAPVAEPAATENFAKTDSNWHALAGGSVARPTTGDDLLSILASAPREPQQETPVGAPMPSASARPPADLSAVFSTSTAAPAPVVEASQVFAPAVKPPPMPEAVPLPPAQSQTTQEAPALHATAEEAVSQPVQAEVPAAHLIACPICSERQPMRLLCRACGADLKRALAAQQEARAQARAEGGVRGASGVRAQAAQAGLEDGSLLAAIGFFWRLLGLDPLFTPSTPPTPTVVPTTADSSPPAAVASGEPVAPGVGPAPPEAEVALRLPSPAAVAEFRQRYWQQPTNKVFVYAGGNVMAWRGGSPSVARALAEAMSECESRRPAAATPCQLVNVNNYWQD
jgi:hypothetical protein